jgi:hypothetical protein
MGGWNGAVIFGVNKIVTAAYVCVGRRGNTNFVVSCWQLKTNVTSFAASVLQKKEKR